MADNSRPSRNMPGFWSLFSGGAHAEYMATAYFRLSVWAGWRECDKPLTNLFAKRDGRLDSREPERLALEHTPE